MFEAVADRLDYLLSGTDRSAFATPGLVPGGVFFFL
jgi:hypothetical protein